MKQLALICFLAFFAGLLAGAAPVRAKDIRPGGKQEAVETKTDGDAGTVPDQGADSGISTETDAGVEEGIESKEKSGNAAEDPEKKEFVSVRKKKNPFTFHMAFSIGGMGYGIMGPRQSRNGVYQFKYLEQSFMAGFRGGVEALFSPVKRHSVSVGAYYEQRRIQLKIGDVSLSRLLFPALTPEQVYFLPLARYVDKSNIDTNYITLPVGYRFFVLDEFYIGFCLDVAILFQAKANYTILSYTTGLNFMRYLSPVDFGGRLLVGFTMNKVFIEIGVGCGFLDIDRLPGERRTININGMVGYRI